MSSNKVSAMEAEERIKGGECVVLDVREPDEFNGEHIPGAVNLPLSSLDADAVKKINPQGLCLLQCRSGNRAEQAYREIKAANPDLPLAVLEGGVLAWKSAGLAVKSSSQKEIPVMRLVQIIAGSLVFIFTLLGLTVHRAFLGIPIFIGAGLTFAGVTGWCGMAMLINKLRGK